MVVVKVAVVGDHEGGKTSLFVLVRRHDSPGEHTPHVFGDHKANLMIYGKTINLAL